jgi:NADPH:quinone reductase-like Zn-dependent oxidoreductase
VEAYRIDRFGSVDGIVLRSNEDPRPGLREILMRVRASSCANRGRWRRRRIEQPSRRRSGST